jgi:hypothetical protein
MSQSGGVLVCERKPPKSSWRRNGGDWTEEFTRSRLEHSPPRQHYFTPSVFLQTQREETMKRALITIATVGILAPTAWVAGANAQYGSPAPPAYSPPPAYNPSSSYAPAPRYTRRAYRRTARQTYRAQTYPGAPPAVYAGGTAFTPGSGGQPYAVTPQSYAAQSAQPNEWYGPMKRGNMCTTHVDINRGYGYQAPCKK